jgi:dUTP pyrophosphatase
MTKLFFKYKKINPLAKLNIPKLEGDVGYDISVLEDKIVWPFFPQKVKTGVCFELPMGYYATIRTRSGHGITKNLRVHPGVIDNGFRGEIAIKVYNLGVLPYRIKKGEKIAQIVLCPSVVFPLQEVAEITTTERGVAGFGSTG